MSFLINSPHTILVELTLEIVWHDTGVLLQNVFDSSARVVCVCMCLCACMVRSVPYFHAKKKASKTMLETNLENLLYFAISTYV